LENDDKVLTSGVVSMVNGREGRIQAITQFPSFTPGNANADITLIGYVRYTNARIRQNSNQIQIGFDQLLIDKDKKHFQKLP